MWIQRQALEACDCDFIPHFLDGGAEPSLIAHTFQQEDLTPLSWLTLTTCSSPPAPECMKPVRRPAWELEWTGTDQNVRTNPIYKHTVNLPKHGVLRKSAGSGYVRVDTLSSVTSSLAIEATQELQ